MTRRGHEEQNFARFGQVPTPSPSIGLCEKGPVRFTPANRPNFLTGQNVERGSIDPLHALGEALGILHIA